MKKEIPKKATDGLQPERMNLKFMLAKNPNYFGNLPGSKIKPVLQWASNTSFEKLDCVGYNPDTGLMEATFSILRPTGYGGSLCTAGGFEYVRFYLDFHDGAGFMDQGSVAINVHDIPDTEDCKGNSNFPLHYVATLKRKSWKLFSCESPLLPTLRAILSFDQEPPANSPTWNPVWGNVMDCDVQFKPTFKWPWPFDFIDVSDYLTLAAQSPNLTIAQLGEVTGADLAKIQVSKPELSLPALARKYEKAKVPASRFAFKAVYTLAQDPVPQISFNAKSIIDDLKLNIDDILDNIVFPWPIDTSKANVEYEELDCMGIDYNTETLVATLKIKKQAGYNGDLCDDGSREYVAFWIDWGETCTWEYLDTVELRVHDLPMKGDHLCYSVSLPLDAKYHRKLCSSPNIVRLRGVLSWNIPPSTTDPNHLQYYGNRVDTHIQIKPGVVLHPGDVIPLFNIMGGIDVSRIHTLTGLTTAGAFFAENGLPVPAGAPFGGVIVLNGPTFPGYRYRIRVTNLTNGSFFYASNPFTVVGHLTAFPWVQYTNQAVDSDGYYHFLNPEQNTLNVLARVTPGTEDKYRIDMEVDSIPGVFSKVIQIDNTAPVIQLQVNDGGNCTHYSIGDTITGFYFVNDPYILSWGFSSTWGGNTSGTSNTPGMPGTPFSIPTPPDAHPCGQVGLSAVDKTIVNSQHVGHYSHATYTICLHA